MKIGVLVAEFGEVLLVCVLDLVDLPLFLLCEAHVLLESAGKGVSGLLEGFYLLVVAAMHESHLFLLFFFESVAEVPYFLLISYFTTV